MRSRLLLALTVSAVATVGPAVVAHADSGGVELTGTTSVSVERAPGPERNVILYVRAVGAGMEEVKVRMDHSRLASRVSVANFAEPCSRSSSTVVTCTVRGLAAGERRQLHLGLLAEPGAAAGAGGKVISTISSGVPTGNAYSTTVHTTVEVARLPSANLSITNKPVSAIRAGVGTTIDVMANVRNNGPDSTYVDAALATPYHGFTVVSWLNCGEHPSPTTCRRAGYLPSGQTWRVGLRLKITSTTPDDAFLSVHSITDIETIAFSFCTSKTGICGSGTPTKPGGQPGIVNSSPSTYAATHAPSPSPSSTHSSAGSPSPAVESPSSPSVRPVGDDAAGGRMSPWVLVGGVLLVLYALMRVVSHIRSPWEKY